MEEVLGEARREYAVAALPGALLEPPDEAPVRLRPDALGGEPLDALALPHLHEQRRDLKQDVVGHVADGVERLGGAAELEQAPREVLGAARLAADAEERVVVRLGAEGEEQAAERLAGPAVARAVRRPRRASTVRQRSLRSASVACATSALSAE